LGGLQEYAAEQFLYLLELAENCTFLDRKLAGALKEAVDEHWLALIKFGTCP
jgi:hypothetical protein